jgi:hypothetical protein
MHFGFRFFSATLATSLVLLALPSQLLAQGPVAQPAIVAELPDAPAPEFALASAAPVQQPVQQPTPAPATPAQDSSSSPAPSAQPATEKSQHDKAAEQIKEQEQQRVVGILPSFNVSYRSDAVSLTAKQKFGLALRSSTDPVAFAVAAAAAGYHEAMDDDTGFGWGAEGYGKRWGAAYLDAFDGAMIGNAILPSILHQDPRYFRLGHGSSTHRLLYAVASSFICKHDNTGKWEPNYSNVLGNIASGGISNLYYPSGTSGVSQTFTNGFIVTAEGGFGSIFQEFWPDVSRKLLHKDPTRGLDAQVRAADQAAKLAKIDAK